jgi:hypothetical protein
MKKIIMLAAITCLTILPLTACGSYENTTVTDVVTAESESENAVDESADVSADGHKNIREFKSHKNIDSHFKDKSEIKSMERNL